MAVKTERQPVVEINLDWCKSCGICIGICPVDVFQADERGRPVVAAQDRCTLCRKCELLCPDFAIDVYDAGEKRGEKAS
ncbi:MAG: ferredoxin family protein [Firmicutes bacterium]|nr:ferredoxin family protein [Bacillota bacterium]